MKYRQNPDKLSPAPSQSEGRSDPKTAQSSIILACNKAYSEEAASFDRQQLWQKTVDVWRAQEIQDPRSPHIHMKQSPL